MSGSIFGVIWEISVGYVFLILDVASLLVFPRGDWHRFMTSFVIGNGRISSNRKTYERGGHSSFCVNVSYGVQRQGVDCFLRREFSVNYNNTTRKKERGSILLFSRIIQNLEDWPRILFHVIQMCFFAGGICCWYVLSSLVLSNIY